MIHPSLFPQLKAINPHSRWVTWKVSIVAMQIIDNTSMQNGIPHLPKAALPGSRNIKKDMNDWGVSLLTLLSNTHACYIQHIKKLGTKIVFQPFCLAHYPSPIQFDSVFALGGFCSFVLSSQTSCNDYRADEKCDRVQPMPTPHYTCSSFFPSPFLLSTHLRAFPPTLVGMCPVTTANRPFCQTCSEGDEMKKVDQRKEKKQGEKTTTACI